MTVAAWPLVRLRFSALALLVATGTGALLGLLGDSGAAGPATLIYVGVTILALVLPAAVTAQVLSGQLWIASLLLGQEGAPLLLLMVGVGGVVATAECLSIVARLDTPVPRAPAKGLLRSGRAAAVGAGVFGTVLTATALPGPGGLLAVVLASATCVALASRLLPGRLPARLPGRPFPDRLSSRSLPESAGSRPPDAARRKSD